MLCAGDIEALVLGLDLPEYEIEAKTAGRLVKMLIENGEPVELE